MKLTMKNRKEKSKKIKIKELTKPPKYWDEEGYRYVGVLMEDVQSNFRVFGENLEMAKQEFRSGLAEVKEDLRKVENKVDATFEEVGRIKIELTEVKIKQDLMAKDIKEIKTKQNSMEIDIKEIKFEIKSIKTEISELKQILSQKADLTRLFSLEQRVFNIEKSLKLS